MPSQEFNGVKFYKTSNGYYKSSRGKWMHRAVWEYYNGEIPKHTAVHHIDKNKDNNSISNLCLMDMSEHLAMHQKNLSDEQKEQKRKILVEKAIPASAAWHKSEEGRAWHRELGKEFWAKYAGKTVTKKCEVCGKEYEADERTAYRSKFCSNNCKSAWRRKSGLDREERTCIICGNTFTCNKYSRQKTCSSKCGSVSQSITKTSKYRNLESSL